MKRRFSSLCLVLLAIAAPVSAQSSGCRIPGTSMQWIADYCMSSLKTDDEIPAASCIDGESRVVFMNECAARHHYKKLMCRLAVSRQTVKGDMQRCMADDAFSGPVVRNGGVGG